MTTTVENPYLDEFTTWAGPGEPWMTQQHPPYPWWWPDDRTDMRHKLVKRYAWAIPNAEAIAACVAWSPLVEIGAGTGYWTHLMRQAGADVVAYDHLPVGSGQNTYHETRWVDGAVVGTPGEPHTEILRGNTRMAQRHGDRTLFLCWPPYKSLAAWAAVRRHQRAGGTRVIYVGEGQDGCTGSEEFHDVLYNEYERVKAIHIPQWPGIHDKLHCFEKKK